MTPARGTWVREARTPPRITASSPGITNPTKSAVSAAARKKTAPTAHGPGIEKKSEMSRSSTDFRKSSRFAHRYQRRRSSRAPMIRPFKIPSKASCCGSGRHSATTSSPESATKLLMRKPFSLAGPQPRQRLAGALRSWSLSMAKGYRRAAPNGQPPERKAEPVTQNWFELLIRREANLVTIMPLSAAPPPSLFESGKGAAYDGCRNGKTNDPRSGTRKRKGRSAEHHGSPDRTCLRGPGQQRNDPRDGSASDQGQPRRLRADVLRPGLHEHGQLQEPDHVHRWGEGNPPLPRLSDRTACRELHVSRGGIPAALRGAAQPQAVSGVGAQHHLPHDDPRVPEEIHGRLQLRRASDGDADRHGGRYVHLLSRCAQHFRPRVSHQADSSPDRQDADTRGVRLPAQPRNAVRLPGQQPVVRRELPAHALQDALGDLQAESGHLEGPGRPLHPACRP